MQSDLIKELDKVFGKVAISDIGMVAEAVENRILLNIEELLTQYTGLFIHHSKVSTHHLLRTITTKNTRLRIRINESFEYPDELIVGYLELDFSGKNKNKIKRHPLKIEGLGKYNKVTIVYPRKLNIDVELISKVIQMTFQTCYSWLFQKTKEASRESSIMASTLYSHLKVILAHKKSLYSKIWLVGVANDNLVLLLDEENVIAAAKEIKKANLFPEKSPFSLVSSFLSLSIPFEKAFANKAFKAKKCISGKISDGKYFDEMTFMAISQISVFTNEVSVFPLNTDNPKEMLFASFPTSIKNEIEPVLEIHKDKLTHDYKKFASRIRKLFGTLEKQNLNSGDLGNFFGSAIGGFIKAVSQ